MKYRVTVSRSAAENATFIVEAVSHQDAEEKIVELLDCTTRTTLDDLKKCGKFVGQEFIEDEESSWELLYVAEDV